MVCLNIHLFDTIDNLICSLYTLANLCLAPSQVSLLRSPDPFLQPGQGFDMVVPLPSPPCIPPSLTPLEKDPVYATAPGLCFSCACDPAPSKTRLLHHRVSIVRPIACVAREANLCY